MLSLFRIILLSNLPQAFLANQYGTGPSLNLAALATLDPQGRIRDSDPLEGVKPRIPLSAPKNFTIPAGMSLQYILVGEGTQNYTCSPVSAKDPTLAWSYAGAQAQLRDISKYHGLSRYISNDLMLGNGVKRVLHYNPEKLKLVGFHYYDEVHDGKGTHLAPAFDFSFALGSRGTTSYVMAEKTSSTCSPSKCWKHIPWQVLKVIKGDFCKTILRTNTRGGWPPNGTCPEVDATLQVDYSAVYWLYK